MIKNIKKASVKKLIEEAKGLSNAINNSDCFSASDNLWYESILSELYKRGYEIHEKTELVFEKV